jgi:uncharacterized protein
MKAGPASAVSAEPVRLWVAVPTLEVVRKIGAIEMRKLPEVKGAAVCVLLMCVLFGGAPAQVAGTDGRGAAPTPRVSVYGRQGQKAPDRNLAGTWHGVLDVGQAKLRLVLNVVRQADGSYKATLDSPDQNATGIPVESVTLKDANVRVELKTIGGAYEGTLDAEGSTLTGNWSQGGSGNLPLNFRRSDKPMPAPARPQEPKRPYPYGEEEVSYENRRAGVRLSATLTVPRGKGPHPAVVLITGSGMQDRDETVAGHKPFLVLADHLTRRGIAVLRADDRGWGGPPEAFMRATGADFADDALAGVEFLKARKEIDPKRVGLVGHSEGGMIAPLVAVKSPDVAFLVLLAAPGLPGDRLLVLQTERLLRAAGAGDEAVARHLAIQQAVLAALREEKTDADFERRARAEVSRLLGQMTEEQRLATGLSEAALGGQLRMMLTPWYRSIVAYDPGTTLMRVGVPVLALGGGLDLQVPSRENLSAIEGALKAGGNRNYKTVELPRLNHLFQTAATGSPVEYGQIEETMSPEALKTISDWILQNALPRRRG